MQYGKALRDAPLHFVFFSGNIDDSTVNYFESFEGECYNVACGDRVSNNEILQFLKKKFSKIEIQSAPPRPGDVMHTLADIKDSIKDLGYAPKVQFWEGLEKTFEWWDI